MPNAIKWEAAWVSRGTILTTQLNSLGDGSRSAVGTEIANQTNLDQWGKVEVSVDFGSAPSAGGYLGLYMVVALDGTNYEDGSDTADPGGHNVVAFIPLKAVTDPPQRVTSPVFALQPAKTKFLLLNKAGQAFPASGSTVTLYTTNDEVQ